MQTHAVAIGLRQIVISAVVVAFERACGEETRAASKRLEQRLGDELVGEFLVLGHVLAVVHVKVPSALNYK